MASAPCGYESLAFNEKDYAAIETCSLEKLSFLDFVERHVPETLEFFSDIPFRYNDDKDWVLRCVRERGDLLRKSSPRLQDDIDVVTAAVNNEPSAIQYASERLQASLSEPPE